MRVPDRRLVRIRRMKAATERVESFSSAAVVEVEFAGKSEEGEVSTGTGGCTLPQELQK